MPRLRSVQVGPSARSAQRLRAWSTLSVEGLKQVKDEEEKGRGPGRRVQRVLHHCHRTRREGGGLA
eukprot:539115-Rhodomonas_salina.1